MYLLLTLLVSIQAFFLDIDPREYETRENAVNFMEGLIEGFGGAVSGSFDSCVQDDKQIFEEMSDAVNKINSNDKKEMIKGLEELATISKQVPRAVQECKAVLSDLENLQKAIKNMSNIVSFEYHIGEDLIVNHVQIFNDVRGMLVAYQQKDFYNFGDFLGNALEKLLVGQSQSQPQSQIIILPFQKFHMDIKQVVQIFEGIALGFGDKVSGNFQNCVNDDMAIYNQGKKAVELLMTETAENVEEAIKELAHIANDFPKAIEDCGAALNDMTHIKTAIAEIHSPWTFAFHVGKDILVNGVDIYKQIQDMIEAWKKEDFLAFGTHLGEALEEVFIGKTPAPQLPGFPKAQIVPMQITYLEIPTSEAVEVTKGIIYGFFHQVSPTIDQCIADDTSIIVKMKEAVEALEQKTMSGYMEGMKDLYAVAAQVPEAMKKCGASEKDVETMAEALASLKSPYTLVFHLGKDILVNGQSIYNDFNDMISAFHNSQYEQFGKDLGQALEKIVIGK